MTTLEIYNLLESLGPEAEVQVYSSEMDTVFRIESMEAVEDEDTGRRVLLIEVK